MPEITVQTVAGTVTVSNPWEERVITVAVAQGVKGDTGDTGATGTPGESAYELWLADGNEGSLQDFFDYAGANASRFLDGVPVSLGALTAGDVLTFQSGLWTNTPRSDVTDGGNF
jgi:hypothetical protein